MLWRAILDGAPDAILALDGNGRIAGMNAVAEALFGRTMVQMRGQTLDSLLEKSSALPACLTAARQAGPGMPQRCLHIGLDGTPVTLEVTVTPADGVYNLDVVVLRDVSGRTELEDALIETEERLAGIIANLPGIVFQRMQTPDGALFYPFFTIGVRDILGYSPEDMRVNAEGCLEVVHWADRDEHMAAIRSSAALLEPCVEEFRAITRDGEVRWLRGTSRPQRLSGGEVLWDGVLLDVTDRKRIEQRLEMIMDNAADGIITADEHGCIENVNAAVERLFGYSASELVGGSMGLLMPEPYRSTHADYLSQYLETGESRIIGNGPVEFLGQRRDGSVFPMELATTEVRMEGRRLFVGIARDVTGRKQTEAALRESQERMHTIATHLPGIVYQRVLKTNGQLIYSYVSEGCRQVLGVEPRELLDDPTLFVQALTPEARDSYADALQRSARFLEPLDEELCVIARNGEMRWLRGRSRPRQMENGDLVWDGVLLDVTDRREAEERLSFLAYHDPLTGVANRTRFIELFEQASRRALDRRERLAVLSLGIDRFTIINTTMGHAVGDQVLIAVAQRLQKALKSGDLLARASGDRFLVLLDGLATKRDINRAVDRILSQFHVPVVIEAGEFDLSACGGVALYPNDGDDASTLIRNAEAALADAKSQGPGTQQFYTREMNDLATRTLSVQNRLRRALEHEEFVAFYQPQLDLQSGAIVGMEALVRWMDPEKGIVPPGDFIPVAEEYGLIDAICEQVLRDSCRHNRAWMEAGLAEVPVAVNISGRQFQNSRQLIATVQDVLAETGLPPRLLELELTESSAMSDANTAIAVVQMLKEEMGISCSIDDFGTGYSSLSVLKRFPIRKLKIDRSFVTDAITDPNDAAIVKAIIAMAHALKLKVVAEGVEVVEQLEFLRRLGCDQMQGYFFSRPLPADAMEELFRSGRRLPLATAE
ncbi:EAL domain-containing protein [Telmatospirillum sp. J64-1]|uniref:bifunctional diguanylate cyclase/phosphodiesterase n=1 Tax=Telmatospirillum sp. J64-1 TaxID=2502183 RepID=UPI00210689BD|nr:EAL domain-containing protein [Telmatospirillum sp. J64-1]